MKKLILIALFSIFVFSSCDSDDGPSCASKITKALNAFEAYTEDPESSEKCNAYKTALENSLGCYGDEAAEANTQAAIDDLECQ